MICGYARTAIEGVSTVKALFERGMIVERTQAGKAVACQDSNFREGRPKKFAPTQLRHALELRAKKRVQKNPTASPKRWGCLIIP